ncbi:MAG TPA: hypothetical protein EYP85_13045 [Armatimonadetes bacterium]|nr:hypothetical protein [Armatimonadota bacterium]
MPGLAYNATFWLLVVSSTAVGATTLERGPSPEVEAENQPEFVELYRLRLVNVRGGEIAVSTNGGGDWQVLGRVLVPTERVDRRGFTASKWAPIGTVCATAVNALHLKADHNERDDRGVVFSLVPQEAGRPDYRSGANPTASIYTDIPAGTGIFGGGWAPFVGNPIFLEREEGLEALPRGYVPRRGDALVILVQRPAKYPCEIVFENRFGGLITLRYSDLQQKVIGQVLRPVLGIGRFAGTRFAAKGRLRANHPGVIDISTSPVGQVGGFQIVPANHAMSPETWYVRQYTQWLVVGPLNALDPSWEGVAPLFSYFLQPRYAPDDLRSLGRLVRRVQVQVKLRGQEGWQLMPQRVAPADPNAPLPEEAYTALKEVTHIRILLPLFDSEYPP